MPKFFIIFITSLLSFIVSDAFSAAGSGGTDEEVHAFFDREKITKNARLLGEFSAFYGAESADGEREFPKTKDGKEINYGGIDLVVLGEGLLSPDAVFGQLLRQFDYDPGLYSPEVVRAGQRMKDEARSVYDREREKTAAYILNNDAATVLMYFSTQNSLLETLTRNSVFFNRVHPNRRRGEHFLEHARLKAEFSWEQHNRWEKNLYHTTSLRMLDEDEDLRILADFPEYIEGSRLTMMPALGWAVGNMASAYEDALRRFTRMLIGKYSPEEFLEYLEGHEAMRPGAFFEFPNDKADGDFRIILGLVNSLIKDKKASGEGDIRREHEEAFLKTAAKTVMSGQKLKPPKKSSGKKGRKTARVYVEHVALDWIKEVRKEFIVSWEAFKEVVLLYKSHKDGSTPVPETEPVEELAVQELRERLKKAEEEAAERAAQLELAERRRQLVSERRKAKEAEIARRKEEVEAERKARLESVETKKESADADADAESEVEEERKARVIAAEAEVAGHKAEQTDALRRIKREEEMERRKAEAALERAEEHHRRAQAYRSKLEEALLHTKTVEEGGESEERVAVSLSSEIRKSADRKLFSQVFSGKPANYEKLIKLLGALKGITVGSPKSSKPHIYFDMPDGSTEMITVDKPHKDGTMHLPSQSRLAGRLTMMGYTKEHFGIE